MDKLRALEIIAKEYNEGCNTIEQLSNLIIAVVKTKKDYDRLLPFIDKKNIQVVKAEKEMFDISRQVRFAEKSMIALSENKDIKAALELMGMKFYMEKGKSKVFIPKIPEDSNGKLA